MKTEATDAASTCTTSWFSDVGPWDIAAVNDGRVHGISYCRDCEPCNDACITFQDHPSNEPCDMAFGQLVMCYVETENSYYTELSSGPTNWNNSTNYFGVEEDFEVDDIPVAVYLFSFFGFICICCPILFCCSRSAQNSSSTAPVNVRTLKNLHKKTGCP